MRSGETIVLSGLLQRTTGKDIDQVPLLGNIPVLGALFRSKRYQNRETELVVFVTPTVVDTRAPGLVDRVERAKEKLSEHMGPEPFMKEPIQPNVDAGKLFAPVGAPAAAPAPAPAATPGAQ